MICNLIKCSGDQITKNEMREKACGVYGGQEGYRKGFDGKRPLGRHVACMGDRRGAERVLMKRPDGKRPLGRHWRGWEDNIQIDLQEVRWGGMD
jgi:hypothetical protein